MFKLKLLFVALLPVLFTACSSLPPAGNYIVHPYVGPVTPDVTFCEYGQCYNVKFSDEIFQPTPEIIPTPEETPVPTPFITPIPPVLCTITADSNVNVRVLPGGTQLGAVLKGDTIGADAKYVYNGIIYFRIEWPPTGQKAWTADYYTEKGTCDSLPVVNPF